MYKIYLFIIIICSTSIVKNNAAAQGNHWFKPDKKLVKVINKNFSDAVSQYKLLSTQLPPDKFPKTF